MKPDWKDAPGWANYLAMDANGNWFWHEDEPYKSNLHDWLSRGMSRMASTIEVSPQWDLTLEHRPET